VLRVVVEGVDRRDVTVDEHCDYRVHDAGAAFEDGLAVPARVASNPCTSPLTSTVVAANGTETTEPATPATNPPIDCFYVYPTVSAQTTPVATLRVDPEKKAIAVTQASRFSQVCRVYAPMYRQATLPAITGAAKQPSGGRVALDVGYQDVLTAWRDYLAHDNQGHGVVLIGHSQGSAVLSV
jgi:hypothetical protein